MRIVARFTAATSPPLQRLGTIRQHSPVLSGTIKQWLAYAPFYSCASQSCSQLAPALPLRHWANCLAHHRLPPSNCWRKPTKATQNKRSEESRVGKEGVSTCR